MDFDCYLKHDSSFEPTDCAKYYKELNLDVVIESDFTDDILKISVSDSKTGKSFVFESNKMDRAEYNSLLEAHPKQASELKKYNSKAALSLKKVSDQALAFPLLEFLHKNHKAFIFSEYGKEPLSAKQLKEKREKSITEYTTKKPFVFKEFAEKYHLDKILISIIFLVGYFIFDSKVNYGTDVLFFIIVIGLIVLWIQG